MQSGQKIEIWDLASHPIAQVLETAASKWLLQFLVRRRADSELDGGQNTVIMDF